MPKTASVWENRIVKRADLAPDQLLANPKNFRRHTREQKDAFRGLVAEVGYIDPVLCTLDDTVIDGHLRVEVALEDGIATIPVDYYDGTPEQADLILATKDPLAAMAFHDQMALDTLVSELWSDDANVQALLESLRGEAVAGTQGLTDPDEVPPLPEVPITKPGDLWLLGRHRMLCGDATVATDVERLMDGAKADMVFTDPPYNAGRQQGRTQTNWRIIENDDMPAEQFLKFLEDVALMASITANGDWYVCCDHRSYTPTVAAFEKAQGTLRSCIVWAKDNFGLGVGYRRQHEFVAYWGTFAGTRESDLWSIPKVRSSDYEHPTQKPTALAERAITNSSKANDLILDLFGGSGSTLIACEQTGRRCAMMEIDPHYCDVIVNRWQNFTGSTAVLGHDHAMAAT